MFVVLSCLGLGITFFAIVHGEIKWAAERGIKTFMASYGDKPSVKLDMDMLQTELKCCGVHGYQDWFEVIWQNTAK